MSKPQSHSHKRVHNAFEFLFRKDKKLSSLFFSRSIAGNLARQTKHVTCLALLVVLKTACPSPEYGSHKILTRGLER